MFLLLLLFPFFIYSKSLDVPFVKQKDQFCGPASLSSVLGFYGISLSQEAIADKVYNPKLKGALITDLENYVKSLGLKAEMIMEEILPHEEREKPLIIEEELVIEKPMSVEDAIFELQDSGVYFLPFVDISTGTLKIAYRKRGGNFGVINTKCKGM